jgi:hypothetical protein
LGDLRACGRAQVLQTRIAREATVLFIDIKGFTAGCAQMTVAQVRSPAATLQGGCSASSQPQSHVLDWAETI